MSTSKALVTTESDIDFEWTDQREKAFDMVMRGVSVRKIAEEIGVHFNTVQRWKTHQVFMRRMMDEKYEHAATTVLRRTRVTTVINDTISNMALKALTEAEKHPTSSKKLKRVKDVLAEFRAMRNEERLNFGESTNNSSVSSNVRHSGHVSTGSKSFRDFLSESAAKGFIDVEAISQKENGQEALIEAVAQALIGSDYIDKVDQETADNAGVKRKAKGNLNDD